ncbi:MAG: magnesium protoporphyrin IX methyltransferase [Myxococcales bacterium]|nr:magnesium protoporphyrin IX methyltransferase [Myxococcales bacterium]
METPTYLARRQQLETYFDRTAADAWAKLTAEGPVSRIRATVRAGRDQMRATLLSYLPADLTGMRVLDAGCGTGALAVEAARRGAQVVAIDLSATLVSLARERLPAIESGGSVDFRVSDMLDPALGRFDFVVAMDSLIHYRAKDKVEMVARLAERADRSVVFTFAPRTVLLTLMGVAGKVLPRGNRSPDLAPIREVTLRRLLAAHPALADFSPGRCQRINTPFYKSQAFELTRQVAA